MTDPSIQHRDVPPDTDQAGTPRWVKVFAVIALVVIVLLAVALIAGGGKHGPGRHMGSVGGETAARLGSAPVLVRR